MGTVKIAPGNNFASIIAAANAGDLIRFLPGTHEGGLDGNNALISVDKSLSIELAAGAILKLANGEVSVDTVGERIENQMVPIPGITHSGTYTGTDSVYFWIQIDGTGTPNTFLWKKLAGAASKDLTGATAGVAITGSPQLLSDGISVTFPATTGFATTQGVILSFGSEYIGIRIGTGLQSSYIEDVKVYGMGKIDMNETNNLDKWSVHSKNLPAGILYHGRVRNVGFYGIEITDIHRAVIGYGEHDGTYLDYGAVSGGTEYIAEYIDIIGLTVTQLREGQAGILAGHPEHRGAQRGVRIMNNKLDVYSTPIEPNFLLDNFVVSQNFIRNNYLRPDGNVYLVHNWRKSTNGVICNNFGYLFVVGGTNYYAYRENAPGGWDQPANCSAFNNYILSDANGDPVVLT